ncbi:hypothetical protein ABIE49_000057 [Bradyrhizobium sp. OAE829]
MRDLDVLLNSLVSTIAKSLFRFCSPKPRSGWSTLLGSVLARSVARRTHKCEQPAARVDRIASFFEHADCTGHVRVRR